MPELKKKTVDTIFNLNKLHTANVFIVNFFIIISCQHLTSLQQLTTGGYSPAWAVEPKSK